MVWYALIWISLGWLLQILTRMVKATLQHQWHGHHTRYNFPFTNLELCLRTSACLKQQVIQKRRSKWHCWKPKRTVVNTRTKKIQAVKKRQWLVTKQCIKDISRSFSAIWFMPWACTEFTRQNHSGDNRALWRLLSVTHEPLLSYTKRKKRRRQEVASKICTNEKHCRPTTNSSFLLLWITITKDGTQSGRNECE